MTPPSGIDSGNFRRTICWPGGDVGPYPTYPHIQERHHMGRKHDLNDRGHPTPGQRRLAKGWLEQADPELAALRDAPGSRAEKRERLAEYLAKRPKVDQDDAEALMDDAAQVDDLARVRGGTDAE